MKKGSRYTKVIQLRVDEELYNLLSVQYADDIRAVLKASFKK